MKDWGASLSRIQLVELFVQVGARPFCQPMTLGAQKMMDKPDFSNSNLPLCDICLFQPMEIYVDDEAKLTLHGLVQVFLVCLVEHQ